MRFSLVTIILTAGIAFGADKSKPVTYLEGNLDGFATNASATLEFKDTKVMVLRTKGADAEIAYSAVSSTSRKVVQVITEKDPLYKVWTLHKRLLIPAPLEQLTVVYKDRAGAQKSVTFEIETEGADRVQAKVTRAEEQKAANLGSWWGDSVWKTDRNKDQWGGAGVIAQRE